MYFLTSSLHFHQEDVNTNNFFNYLKLFQHQLTTLYFKPDAVSITGLSVSTQEWLQHDYSALHLGTSHGKNPTRSIGRVMRKKYEHICRFLKRTVALEN